jgi:hypothetical protein
LVKIVNNSNGELDIAIRVNYLNIYYKGNSLAKISFKEPDKYKLEIHKKFFVGTSADTPKFYEKAAESNNCRFRKKSNFCVVLHFAIIQRTISTPHDYKICTP